jgi:hypothetical protein
VGVDIAPQMLEITLQNLAAAGLDNATAVQGDDTLSLVQGSFNFVNSYIVLQHIPPDRGMLLIKRLLGILEVGGVFSLQLTYAKERKFFPHFQQKAEYFRQFRDEIKDLVPTEAMHEDGTVTMFDYDLNEFMLRISAIAGEPLLVLPTNHDGHMGVHVIGVKARPS